MAEPHWRHPSKQSVILAAITVTGLALRLFRLGSMSYWFAKPPYRDAATLIAEQAQPGDIEVHTSDGSYLPFRHYQQPLPVYLLTGDPDSRKPAVVYALVGGQLIEPQDAFAQDRRIWLVVALEHSLEYQAEMVDWFTRQRPILEQFNVGGIRVYLLADGTPL